MKGIYLQHFAWFCTLNTYTCWNMCLFIIDTNILCLFYALMPIRLTYFTEHRTMSQWLENGFCFGKTELHKFTQIIVTLIGYAFKTCTLETELKCNFEQFTIPEV